MTRQESRVSNGRYWGAHEIERMIQLHEDERLSWIEVGAKLNRTPQSCSSKYSYERAHKGRADNHKMVTVLHVPPSVLIERDQRALAPRSLSALFFGDPPQGFSALDRRGA